MELSCNKGKTNINDVKSNETTNPVKGFKEYFKEYCENSSINGFKYIAEERTFIERYVIFSFH